MKYMVYMGSSNFQLAANNNENHLPIIQNWMEQNQITGLVLNLNDELLHYLEGEQSMIEEAYEFLNVYYGTISPKRLVEGELKTRLFKDWNRYGGGKSIRATEDSEVLGLFSMMNILTEIEGGSVQLGVKEKAA